MTSVDELNDILEEDEQDNIDNDEQPADEGESEEPSKIDDALDDNRSKLVESLLTKVVKGDLSLEKIEQNPAQKWALKEIKGRLEAITGTTKDPIEDDFTKKEIENLKKEMQELKAISLKKEKEAESVSAKQTLNQFVEKIGYTKKEFEKEFGDQFIANLKELTDAGISKAKATKLALAEIASDFNFEELSMKSKASGLATPPSSGKSLQRGLPKELTAENIDKLSAKDLMQYIK